MNEVFSFRNIPRESRGKESMGNDGRNSKVEAALTKAKDKFYKTKQGRFLRLIGKDLELQNEVLYSIGIKGNRSEGFIRSLKAKGFIDMEETGSKLLVTKIHNEKVENMLEENLYDKELLGFIKENNGMNVTMIAFCTKKSINIADKRIRVLKDLGLIIDSKPLNKPSRYYFSSDFVIEGKQEQTRKKMIAEIRKREEEFEEKRQMMKNKKV